MKPSLWHDEGLQGTNPVFVLNGILADMDARFPCNWQRASSHLACAVEGLVSAGIPVPSSALEDLKPYLPAGFSPKLISRRHGVLGLVVSIGSEVGFVFPLRCQLAVSDWDESLPFRPEAVLDVLVQLVGSAGLPTAGILPERLQFTFENSLGHRAAGNSITVAASLSVLDALNEYRSELLRCACAVLEPSEGGQFCPVEHIRPKLEAVIREHGGASLLLCTPECREVSGVRSRFEVVWEVQSFEQLAAKLDEAGILSALFRKVPLCCEELERVQERLRILVRTRHRYQGASALGRRLVNCPTTGAVPVSLWSSIRTLVAESHRHQGRFQEAYDGWKEIQEEVQADGHLTSYDQRADTAAEFAATLFDCHRFGEIPCVLEDWVATIRDDPQKISPATRVKVLNTLGRALIVLAKEGWDEHFRRSLELQERLDPGNVLRTKCYQIHGMLRGGLHDPARRALEEVGPLEQVRGLPGWQLRFLRADLARRTGAMWDDPELEEVRPGNARPGHPVAWYLQARGRQFCSQTADGQGSPEQACEYLHRAADFLRHDAENQPQNICAFFASCLDLYAASLAGSASDWTKSANEVQQFLHDAAAEPLREHYSAATTQLGDSANRSVAEDLLSLIPYL